MFSDLLRILRIQILIALRASLEYRVDFWVHLLLSFLWTIAILLPLWVVFQHRSSIAGWEWYDALFVSGFFTLFLGVIEGMIQPSLTQLVESFRSGNMDLLLLKPIDPQILIATLKIQPWNATDSIAGIIILIYAIAHRPSLPTLEGVFLAGFFILCGLILIYDITFMAAALGVVFVKVDNLIYLFLSLLDAARWPTSIFPLGLRIIFTLLIPISIMTTFPAEALRGKTTFPMMITALLVTLGFTFASRSAFRQAMKSYMSAGG